MSTLIEHIKPDTEKDKIASGKVKKQVGPGRYLIDAGGYTTMVTSHVGDLRTGELISVMKIGMSSVAVNRRGLAGMSAAQWLDDKSGYGRVDISAKDPNKPEIDIISQVGRVFYING